jgi:crotonobetainyl-CoA:carnitine CoA-transferase CaiB-like acyl-CoA transferase
MEAAGKPEMAADPRLSDNAGRVAHQDELDGAISEWTTTLTSGEVLDVLERVAVPCGPINSVADMMSDPHFRARGLFEEVSVDGAPLKVPALTPMLAQTPGRTDWPGPDVGEHNQEILCGRLGLSEETLTELKARGVV